MFLSLCFEKALERICSILNNMDNQAYGINVISFLLSREKASVCSKGSDTIVWVMGIVYLIVHFLSKI